MATLLGLEIQGIRSFGGDDLDGQSIEFEKPFNLILGRNGCGKTTIIEALKYACTGTLPPGQGTNFVRDPKLDRRAETRASVKLKFLSSVGKKMHVAKFMSSTQKFKSLQFKTMDITTTIEEAGEKKQLSGRHADAEVLICKLLGVSKPILNYVIFCHQEESHWPLDESKKLKERFDEIFDSTKYNKCMEDVRKQRKKVMDGMKVDAEAMKYLKEKVGIVKQKRGELEEFLERQKATVAKLQSLASELKLCEIEKKKWYKKVDEFVELRKRKDNEETRLKVLEERQQHLKTTITYIFEGSEEELVEEINKYDSEFESVDKSIRGIQRDVENKKREEKETQDCINAVKIDIGKLQSDKNQEQRWQKERNMKLSQFARVANLPALSIEPSESEVSEVIANIKKHNHSLARSIEALERQHTNEEKDLDDCIKKCVKVKAELETMKKQKESEIDSNENDIQELSLKINRVNVHRSRKDEIERDLHETYQDRETAQRAENPETLSIEIETLGIACQELEKRSSSLNSEISELRKIQDVQTKIKVVHEKKEELQSAMKKLKFRNQDFISKHLDDATDETLKQDFETLIQKWKTEVDNVRSLMAEKNQKESSLELSRKHVKAQLDQKKIELGRNKEALFELCGKRNLNDVLDAVQKQIHAAQNDKGLYDASSVMFSNYIKKLGVPSPCCPLCNRGFDDDSQIADLISSIEDKKANIPAQVRAKSEELTKFQEKQTKLLRLKPVEESTKKLEVHEIPQLEKEMADIEDRLEEVKQEIPLLEASMQGTQADLRSAEAIRSDIYEFDRSQREFRKQTSLLENMKRNNPCTNLERTFDQAVEEQQRIWLELNSKRKERDTAAERLRVYEKRIIEFDQKIIKLKDQQLQIDQLIQEEQSDKIRLDELMVLKSTLEAEVDEVKKKLPSARDDLKEAEKALKLAKDANYKALQSKQKEERERQNDASAIMSLQHSIKISQDKKIDEKLHKCDAKIKEFQGKLNEIDHMVQSLNSEKDKLTAIKANREGRKKDLESNQQLIQVLREIDRQKVKVDELVREVGDADYLGTRNKCNELEEQYTKIFQEHNELSGGSKIEEENIRSRQKELNDPVLRNAEEKYKEKLIEFTVKSYVEKDLQKYYSAIDFAMQRFHKERMDCVNSIIRELWRLIYKGNDIDHIEIETDESATTGSAGTEKRKTYNYRVVQVRDGTKIEMKGRCSAGQKVLACLIIRMALAETFSSNCGILTLDEPTTNLDKDNIRSLCDAISRIITDREGRKGFQLIVITHDMLFLRAMSNVDAFEHYWEVSRNHQSKSQITKRAVIKT